MGFGRNLQMFDCGLLFQHLLEFKVSMEMNCNSLRSFSSMNISDFDGNTVSRGHN